MDRENVAGRTEMWPGSVCPPPCGRACCRVLFSSHRGSSEQKQKPRKETPALLSVHLAHVLCRPISRYVKCPCPLLGLEEGKKHTTSLVARASQDTVTVWTAGGEGTEEGNCCHFQMEPSQRTVSGKDAFPASLWSASLAPTPPTWAPGVTVHLSTQVALTWLHDKNPDQTPQHGQ